MLSGNLAQYKGRCYTSTMTDEQVLNTVKELQTAYRLKRTMRYYTPRNLEVHSESVAEHVFAIFFIAEYFIPLEDPKGMLDVAKIHRMILFHDFGEILKGDIPYHLKTEAHEKQEQDDASVVFASLPETMQQMARDHWQEFEDKTSPEAQFVQALDKIEPCFELFDPINAQSMMRLKMTFSQHMEKKLKATEHFPIMRRFVEVVGNELNRRGIFWEE